MRGIGLKAITKNALDAEEDKYRDPDCLFQPTYIDQQGQVFDFPPAPPTRNPRPGISSG